jgi:hypothetical protein
MKRKLGLILGLIAATCAYAGDIDTYADDVLEKCINFLNEPENFGHEEELIRSLNETGNIANLVVLEGLLQRFCELSYNKMMVDDLKKKKDTLVHFLNSRSSLSKLSYVDQDNISNNLVNLEFELLNNGYVDEYSVLINLSLAQKQKIMENQGASSESLAAGAPSAVNVAVSAGAGAGAPPIADFGLSEKDMQDMRDNKLIGIEKREAKEILGYCGALLTTIEQLKIFFAGPDNLKPYLDYYKSNKSPEGLVDFMRGTDELLGMDNDRLKDKIIPALTTPNGIFEIFDTDVTKKILEKYPLSGIDLDQFKRIVMDANTGRYLGWYKHMLSFFISDLSNSDLASAKYLLEKGLMDRNDLTLWGSITPRWVKYFEAHPEGP